MKKLLYYLIITAIFFAAAYFLCRIKPATEYGWLAAIWHGLFLFPNFILHWIDGDILFYSELPTTAYKICFGIGVALNALIGETFKLFSNVVEEVQNQQ